MIIEPVSEDDATGITADLYAADLQSQGFIPRHTRAMALNPEALLAFQQLAREVAGSLGLRRYELVTLAAAQAIGSKHCRLAHGWKSMPVFDAPQLEAIARDFHDAGLTEAEVAMMEYAQRMCGDSRTMTDDDTQRLRQLGFTDREIVDITLAASLRNYFSRALNALAVPLDEEELARHEPALREALLSGT